MSVSLRNKKLLVAAGAGALTAALLGGGALAAFAPVTYGPVSEVEAQLGTAAPANSGTDKLKAILDALAAKGVITSAQVDAIVAAVGDAEARGNGGEVKRIFAGVLTHSVDFADLYFQLSHEEAWSLEDGIVNVYPGAVYGSDDILCSRGCG